MGFMTQNPEPSKSKAKSSHKTDRMLRRAYQARYAQPEYGKIQVIPEKIRKESAKLIGKGMNEEAMALLNQYPEVENDPLALTNRGLAYESLAYADDVGMTERTHLIERALHDEDVAETLVKKLLSDIRCNKAHIKNRAKRYYEALMDADLAIEVFPHHAAPYINKMSAYLGLDDIDACWGVLEKMPEIWPEGKDNSMLKVRILKDGALEKLRKSEGFNDRIYQYINPEQETEDE